MKLTYFFCTSHTPVYIFKFHKKPKLNSISKIKKKKSTNLTQKTKNLKIFFSISKFSICFLLWQNDFYSLSESSDAIEERLDNPKLGGPLTSDVVPNNLYHPMTIFDKFRSSNII